MTNKIYPGIFSNYTNNRSLLIFPQYKYVWITYIDYLSILNITSVWLDFKTNFVIHRYRMVEYINIDRADEYWLEFINIDRAAASANLFLIWCIGDQWRIRVLSKQKQREQVSYSVVGATSCILSANSD